MRFAGWLALLLVGPVAVTPVALAHTQGSSHAVLAFDGSRPATLAVDLAPIDLLHELDLDRNGDGRLTWGEVEASRAAIQAFVQNGVRVGAGNAGNAVCRETPAEGGLSFVRRDELPWLRLRLDVDCPPDLAESPYRLQYDLFFDADPSHRLLLRVAAGGGDSVFVLSAADRSARFAPGQPFLARAGGFVPEGFRHILSGYDHLAFLLLLILPQAGRSHLRTRLLRVAGIVTAFTAAHSVTLAAAILGLVAVPAQPVEIAIAASVVLAALMNVVRPEHAWGWQAALAFGLLHGFGFAGALADMNLGGAALSAALLGFNLGIELGQLLVVALALPLLTLLSSSAHYRSLLVPAASLACAALGVAWTTARF